LHGRNILDNLALNRHDLGVLGRDWHIHDAIGSLDWHIVHLGWSLELRKLLLLLVSEIQLWVDSRFRILVSGVGSLRSVGSLESVVRNVRITSVLAHFFD